MPRCSICSTFALEILLEKESTVPFKHHASNVHLIQSAETCDLCALILEPLQEELERQGLDRFGQLYLWSDARGEGMPGTIHLETFGDPRIDLMHVLKVCSWTSKCLSILRNLLTPELTSGQVTDGLDTSERRATKRLR